MKPKLQANMGEIYLSLYAGLALRLPSKRVEMLIADRQRLCGEEW